MPHAEHGDNLTEGKKWKFTDVKSQHINKPDTAHGHLQKQDKNIFSQIHSYDMLPSEHGDIPTVGNTWKFIDVKSQQINQRETTYEHFQLSTGQNGGVLSVEGLQDTNDSADNLRNMHHKVGLTESNSAGHPADFDVDFDSKLTPVTEEHTPIEDHAAPKSAKTALKSNLLSIDNFPATSSLVTSVMSGYGTATATNMSTHACEMMENNTCTPTHSSTTKIIPKAVAANGFEETKRQKAPVVFAAPPKPQYYSKSTYAVLIQGSIREVNTKVYSSLPIHSKYLVKERIPGTTKAKLAMKSCYDHKRLVEIIKTLISKILHAW